jgi:hypothetical protein
MGTTLDAFKAQQKAAEALHGKLMEVATLLSDLKGQVDTLRLVDDLKRAIEHEQQWLTRTHDLLRDVQHWRDGELRQARRVLRWRWAAPFAFALASSVATGAGLLWAWRPFAEELARVRTQVEFAEAVESRLGAMTNSERQEFERLMHLSQTPRR